MVTAWYTKRRQMGLVTSNHEDMHGAEAETSILLATAPEVVRPIYLAADECRHLLTLGMRAYSPSDVIGRPSLATADKGRLSLEIIFDPVQTPFSIVTLLIQLPRHWCMPASDGLSCRLIRPRAIRRDSSCR